MTVRSFVGGLLHQYIVPYFVLIPRRSVRRNPEFGDMAVFSDRATSDIAENGVRSRHIQFDEVFQ